MRGGHEIILSAFDNFKEVQAAQRRGEVEGVGGGGWSEEETNMSLHLDCAVSNGDSALEECSPGRRASGRCLQLLQMGWENVGDRLSADYRPQFSCKTQEGLTRHLERTVTCVSTGFGRQTKAPEQQRERCSIASPDPVLSG